MVVPMNTPLQIVKRKRDGVHLTLWVDRRLNDELRRVAELNDRSVSAEARQALRDYLRDQPR